MSEDFQKLWYEAYKWGKIHYAVAGMLGNYKKKQVYIDQKNKEITTYKLAGECVYLGLKLIFIQGNPTIPPPFDIMLLMERTEDLLTPE